jgi:hypothetical protein
VKDVSVEQDPFGRSYRAGRISDEETARRMLRVASDRVNREGLRVSFDLLRFEDLIAEAGVARSAVYRRWETKGHFYADLLLELAGHDHPAIAAYDEGTVTLAIRQALEHLELLRTEDGRRLLTVELCRLGALQNFTALVSSREWPVYVTLTATLAGLPDTEFRGSLQTALAKSEQGFLGKMAAFYEMMFRVLGYRLRPELEGVTSEVLAQLGAAAVEGIALNNIAMPEIAATRFQIDPFNTGKTAEWSLAGVGFTSIALLLVEQDPEHSGDWSDDILEERRALLESWENLASDAAQE